MKKFALSALCLLALALSAQANGYGNARFFGVRRAFVPVYAAPVVVAAPVYTVPAAAIVPCEVPVTYTVPAVPVFAPVYAPRYQRGFGVGFGFGTFRGY